MEDNNPIDLKGWTVTELLKHVYREVLELKTSSVNLSIKFDKNMHEIDEKINRLTDKFETKIQNLEKELTHLETSFNMQTAQEEKTLARLNSNSKYWMAGISLFLSVVTFIILKLT